VDAEQLAKIPTVIAVSYGDEKAAAVRAAIRGGLVTGLITHTGLTRRLLELDDELGGTQT
jgi:DNA-binding transcriptional regulator LsrR (DeoR family)